MSAEQLEWLEEQKVNVAQPEWEFGLDESCGFPIPFKGILARTHIRKYFPGYEVYFHIDADAWVQDWAAVELYVAGARKGVMAVSPEIDRSFICNYRNAHAYREFVIHIYTDLQGAEYAEKYRDYPILNTGVFAMPAVSVLWERWAGRIDGPLRKNQIFTSSNAQSIWRSSRILSNISLRVSSFSQAPAIGSAIKPCRCSTPTIIALSNHSCPIKNWG